MILSFILLAASACDGSKTNEPMQGPEFKANFDEPEPGGHAHFNRSISLPGFSPPIVAHQSKQSLVLRFPELKRERGFSAHAYIVVCKETGQALVIDPGAEQLPILELWIREKRPKVVGIAVTHAHFDHAAGAGVLQQNLGGVPIWCGEADSPWMARLDEGARKVGLRSQPAPACNRTFKGGELIELGGTQSRRVVCSGSYRWFGSVYVDRRKVLFGGDTLFFDSVGRTDLPGNAGQERLFTSISEQLLPLPDDTLVLPGHGKVFHLFQAKKKNPYLRSIIKHYDRLVPTPPSGDVPP